MGEAAKSREQKLRQAIVQIGKSLYQKNLIVATDGNISARLNKEQILITPTGVCKGKLVPSAIGLIDLNGYPIQPKKFRPSTEYQMHIAVYNARADINAIIHAHPVFITALASASPVIKQNGQEWLLNLPEIQSTVGKIVMIDYYPPGSKELSQAVKKAFNDANAVGLAKHGVVIGSADLTQAFYALQRVEMGVKLYILTQLIYQFSKI